MKRTLQIFFLLLIFRCSAQTAINNVSIDSVGRLSWNITFVGPDLKIEIQRHLNGKWTTISEPSHNVNYFDEAPKTPELITVADSYIVPLEKGANKYRIIITIPAKFESKEILVNSLNKRNEIYAQNNFIRFDNRINFSINDSNGKEIRKVDNGRMINTADLKVGLYYIVVDKDIYEFVKK